MARAFFQLQAGNCAMEIQQVDVIGGEPLETRFDRLVNPLARLALLIRPCGSRRRKAELGRHDPAITISSDGPPHDFFGATRVVNVRRIEEVDALVCCLGDDALRSRFVGFSTEHHRTQAERGNLQATTA